MQEEAAITTVIVITIAIVTTTTLSAILSEEYSLVPVPITVTVIPAVVQIQALLHPGAIPPPLQAAALLPEEAVAAVAVAEAVEVV